MSTKELSETVQNDQLDETNQQVNAQDSKDTEPKAEGDKTEEEKQPAEVSEVQA